MKTYKIKKLEIPEQVQRYFQQIFNKTGATFLDKINELIDAHNESLSDKEEPKQEECKNCPHDITPTFTDKDLVTMPKQEESLQFKLDPLEKITRIELNPKQATSLKEGCTGCNNATLIHSNGKLCCSVCKKELVMAKIKQQSDLKESIIGTIRETELLDGEKAEHIISLIQSHIVKEIPPPRYTRDMESAGYNQCRGDVIKFICETLSK